MIKINGQVVQAKDKVQIHRKFSEEHDTGKVTIINTQEERYEMYSLVDYETENEQMLVESDNAVQLNATDWQHELTLTENKAKFDGVYPFDRSFTVIDQTLSDILNVYKREFQEYQSLFIDWNLTTEQLNQTITFKEYSGVNFTSILLSLFRSIDAIPYVLRVGQTWQINARPYNKRGSLISESSITKSYQQSNLDYATKVKSQLKNAINERAQVDVEWFPSENGYVLPKSPKPIKATSDLEYKLPSPIVKMLEVVAVDVSYKYADGEGVFFYDTTNVDITSQVVQSEVYDVLPIIDSTTPLVIALTNNAKNNVKYDLYGRTVYDLFEANDDKRFFINIDTPYLLNAIIRVLKPLVDGITGRTFVSLENSGGTDVKTEDIKLRFKYVKQRNIDLIANRKTKGRMNTSTVIHNQRDSSVEISQYKKALRNYSNRQGNNYFSKTKIFPTGTTPHSIADYLPDGKVVVETIKTYHGNFINCDWVEIDNFSNLESEYSLSKRPEPFTINDKTVQTNVVSEEFVWFSERDVGVTTRLTESAQEGLLGLFALTSVSGFEKVHSAVFKPSLASWDSTKAISMELANDGDSNLITFHAYFDHQLLAGNIYYDIDTDTYVDDFQPLKYTDDNGELQDFQFYLVSDTTFQDQGEYPLIIDETNYIANKITNNNVDEPLDLDSNASFAITYNISFVADKHINVGDFLAKNNYLISDQQDTHTIVLYKSTKPYTMDDQVPRTSDTVANISHVYDFANRKITFTANEDVDYFCFTKNGKILLSINKSLSIGENYTIHINILKTLEDYIFYSLSANATGLANLSGTANLVYTEILISANATNLANLTGTATLEYTSRIYELSANASGLANLTGTANLDYEGVEFTLSANATNLATLSGTANLVYTDKQYLLSASGTVGNLSGTADLIYTDKTYALSANASNVSNLSGTANLAYSYNEWDYIGTSAPPQDGTVSLDAISQTCRTPQEVKDTITAVYPPYNYTTGYIMKVEHQVQQPPFPDGACTPFYYRNIEVTE